MQLQVNLPGYENLQVSLDDKGQIGAFRLECSSTTFALFEKLLALFGPNLGQWDLSSIGRGENNNQAGLRSHLLIHELVLKAQGKWTLPYAGELVCICRQVLSETIDNAVVAGAQNVETISRWTTACTSCTSCKSKIEELIDNRLRSNFK